MNIQQTETSRQHTQPATATTKAEQYVALDRALRYLIGQGHSPEDLKARISREIDLIHFECTRS